MGRRSKGNSDNELHYVRKLKSFPPASKKSDPIEVFRSTPSLQTHTPKSFADAAILSRKRTKERELSWLPTPIVSGLSHLSAARILKLGDDSSSLSEISSLGSMVNIASDTMSPVVSPIQTPVDPAVQGDLSKSMMALSLDGIKQISEDSFDSSPDSNFNKGASDFLRLVEQAITRAEESNRALKFENLVMQMINLEMGERYRLQKQYLKL